MDEEELAYGGFFVTPDVLKGKFHEGTYDPIHAAEDAMLLAKHDLDNEIIRHLAYGGPMAPWATPDSIMMRKLGISVYATALCEVDPYTRVFTSVYNAVTAEKLMPWATHPSFTKGFVVNVCSGHLIAPNFDDCLKIKNEHS